MEIPYLVIEENKPEILLAFCQVFSNPLSRRIIYLLLNNSMSINEIMVELYPTLSKKDKIAKMLKSLINWSLKRLELIGIIKREWEGGVEKYRVIAKRGRIEFNLNKIIYTPDIKFLERKAKEVVSVIEKEGSLPRKILMDKINVWDDFIFEQIINYVEKFYLPNIREAIYMGEEIGEETNIEQIAEYIEELINLLKEGGGKLELDTLSKVLGVSRAQIEVWAKILEKYGIMKKDGDQIVLLKEEI